MKYIIFTNSNNINIIKELNMFAKNYDIRSTQFSTNTIGTVGIRYSILVEYKDKFKSDPNADYDFTGH